MVNSAAAVLERPGISTRRADRLFYSGMAVAIAVVVFVGFSPTFYLKSVFHGPPLSLLRIVHGTAFSAWIVLFMLQAGLIAAGRTRVHQRVGVFGACLAAVMIVLGTALAISTARSGQAPLGLDPRVFLVIPLGDMLTFGVFIAAAVYLRHRPEAHKRLMLLATLCLTSAAIARWPAPQSLIALGPVFFMAGTDVLLLAAVVYDLAIHRRVHPTYVWGGLFLVVSQPLRLMISGTGAWLAFAGMLAGS